MNKEAFVRGFIDEMEKEGALPALLPLLARALPAIGKVVTRVGPKVLQAGGRSAGKAMSVGSKGGVGKVKNVASNLGGMADIIRARNPKQPADAGNTITTPGR